MLALGQSPLQPDQYRSSIKSPVLLYSSDYSQITTMIQLDFTITQPSNYYYKYTTTTQLETALCNQYCFCNSELRTATVTKIKGFLIQTQLNTFVLFTLLKLTLDGRKTLTKISTCNLSQQFPQTSARFGHDKIGNRKMARSTVHNLNQQKIRAVSVLGVVSSILSMQICSFNTCSSNDELVTNGSKFTFVP